jgi:hypothetical protein
MIEHVDSFILTARELSRLRQNLIFSNEHTVGAVGAFSILFRNEDQESAKQLYALLSRVLNSQAILPGCYEWSEQGDQWVQVVEKETSEPSS